MITVIGLGQAGCGIADKLSRYPQYKIYMIDVGIEEAENTYSIEKQSSVEEYEEKCPSLDEFFENVEGDVLFACDGSEDISAISLKVLHPLKEKGCSIELMYIRPDNAYLLNNKKRMHEKVTFNVFQEYTRSGVFERVYLIESSKINEMIGEASILEVDEKMNEIIVQTYHMINVLKHSKPVVSTMSDAGEASRMASFSISTFEKEEESRFFDMEQVREKEYYYAINETLVEKDGTLHKKIMTQLRDKTDDNVKISYAVYPTKYDVNSVYCVSYSNQIQGDCANK